MQGGGGEEEKRDEMLLPAPVPALRTGVDARSPVTKRIMVKMRKKEFSSWMTLCHALVAHWDRIFLFVFRKTPSLDPLTTRLQFRILMQKRENLPGISFAILSADLDCYMETNVRSECLCGETSLS